MKVRRLPAVVRRLLQRVRGRLAGGAGDEGDPWEKLDVSPRIALYGAGARHEVEWYFEGESAVPVRSLDELRSWLAGCEYATDADLFQEPDFWQHPRTFERLRRGDCEDFALWAWRKLVELGYDADLVVGRCPEAAEAAAAEANGAAQREGRHAWIVFRRDGGEFLFEPVAGADAAGVRPLCEVRDRYVPEFGLAADRRRFAYAGYRRYRG